MASSKLSNLFAENVKRGAETEIIESLAMEFQAIDEIKHKLAMLDSKIKNSGSTHPTSELKDVKFRKRKIAWSDEFNKLESGKPNFDPPSQMSSKECQPSHFQTAQSSSNKYFDTEAFNQLRNKIEDDFKRLLSAPEIIVVPPRLLNDTVAVSAAMANKLLESSNMEVRKAKPFHGILKTATVSRDDNRGSNANYVTAEKPWSTSAVKSKSLASDFNKRVKRPTRNFNLPPTPAIGTDEQNGEPDLIESQPRVSNQMPPNVKMVWEPIILPTTFANSVPNLNKTRKKPSYSRKNAAVLTLKEIPTADGNQQIISEENAKLNLNVDKDANSNMQKRPMVQKRVICSPKKSEDFFNISTTKQKLKKINADPLVSNANSLKFEDKEILKPPHDNEKETEQSIQSLPLKEIKADALANEKSENLIESKPKNEAVKRKKIQESQEEPVRESTPKLRHYDQMSVRKFIKKQREDRRKKRLDDKLLKQKLDEDKKHKLENLQVLQKTLAALPIKITKSARFVEKETNFNSTSESANSSDLDDQSSTDLLLNKSFYSNLRLQKVKPSKRNELLNAKLQERVDVAVQSEFIDNENRSSTGNNNKNEFEKVVDVNEDIQSTSTTHSSVRHKERHKAENISNRIKINEQLQTLSAMYQETIGRLPGKSSKISKDFNQINKLQNIQNQAHTLHKAIDDAIMALKIKHNKKLQASEVTENGMKCSVVSMDSNISEGKISDTLDSDTNDLSQTSSVILRKIALNTVVSRTGLDSVQSQKDVDWEKFHSSEPPDPQNFVNSWTRKFVSDSNNTLDDKLFVDSNEQHNLKLSKVVENLPDCDFSHRSQSVCTPTISQATDDIFMEMEKDAEDIQSLQPIVGNLVDQSSTELSSTKHSTTIQDDIPSQHSATTEDDIPSQHSLTASFDDQLSEGALSSVVAVEINDGLDDTPVYKNENVLATVENDTLIEQQSLPRDYKDNESLLSNNSLSTVVSADETGDHLIGLYENKGTTSKMMSPNTLRLRLSTELMYLDNINDSLDQLQDVEKVRAVAIAQHEALTLAHHEKQQLSRTENFELPRNTQNATDQKILQTQAEAVKISAEATKQLADLNMSLLEKKSFNLKFDEQPSVNFTATIAASTSAAVTAALSQFKDKFHNSRKLLSASSDSRLHSNKKESSTPSYSSQKDANSGDSKSSPTSSLVSNQKSQGDISHSLTINTKISQQYSSEESIQEELSTSKRDNKLKIKTHHKDLKKIEDNQINLLHGSDQSSSGQDVSFLDNLSNITSRHSGYSSGSSSVSSKEILSDDLLINIGEKSFQDFTLTLVKQNITVEEQRIKHQQAILKFREQALLEKAKAEFEWIKLKKKKYASQGDNKKLALLEKKKNYMIDKFKQEKEELKALKEREKIAVSDRRSILKQQEEIAKLYISNQNLVEKIYEFKTNDSDVNLNLKVNDQRETSETADSLTETVNEDGNSLQKLKNMLSSKRLLENREYSITQRKQMVDELVQWQNKLDKEEIEVQKMEKLVTKGLTKKYKVPTINSSNISESDESNKDEKNFMPRSTPKTERSEFPTNKICSDVSTDYDDPNSSASIVEEYSPSNQESASNDISEVIPNNSSMKRNLTSNSISIIEKLSNSSDVRSSKSCSINTSKESERDNIVSRSIILKEPLAPTRTQGRRRRDSSGSEDSGPISHSETASDASDIEGRILALKEDLRRRRKQAEWLKKEQKRKTKERLKSQENSLLKQIENYDKYITQTKADLQKELEDDNSSKVVVKPVIMVPKVAESKRLNRPTGFDKSPDSDQNKLLQESNSVYDYSETFASPKSTEDQVDAEVASLTASATSLANVDEFIESPRSSLNSSLISEDNRKEDLPTNNFVKDDAKESLSDVDTETEFQRGQQKIVENPEMVLEDSESELQISQQTEVENPEMLLENSESQHFNAKSSAFDITDQENTNLVIEYETIEVPKNDKFQKNIDNSLKCPSMIEESNLKNENVCGENTEILSSDYFVKKIPNDELVEQITSSLLHNMLQIEFKSILAKRKENMVTGNAISTIIEKSCHLLEQKIADNLFDLLLNDSLNAIFSLFKHFKNCHGDSSWFRQSLNESKAAFEEIESKRALSFHHESYISQRVNHIMAEVNEKKSSPTKTRPQDMFILSFSEAIISPENNLSPVLTSPVKGQSGSPIKRPSSPVLGESTEGNPAGLNPSFAVEINPLYSDGLGEDQWFDDDFGLSDGQIRSPNQMRRYQVYPYQDSVYIREIPNKPPPPYTPPGQALPVSSSASTPTVTVSSSSNVSSVQLSKRNANELNNEMSRAVNYDKVQVERLVNTATAFVYSKVNSEIDFSLEANEITGYYTVEDMQDDTNNCSRRMYKEFLLNLVYEIVKDVYLVTKLPSQPIWCKPRGNLNYHIILPKALNDLLPLVQNRVSEMLFPTNNFRQKKLKWGRKKRDFVDEILLEELRVEENGWTTYDEDELTVKMQLSDSIFDMLIVDTIDAVKSSWQKYSPMKDPVLISDL